MIQEPDRDFAQKAYPAPTSTASIWLLVVTPALAVIALWIPFGFFLGGLIEEWSILALFTKYGTQFLATSDLLAAHRARPLTVFPHAVAYALDPNSFFYWHILQIISLIIKASGAALIGYYIVRRSSVALVLGLLTAFYPADTMQIPFRGMHINWSISLAYLAILLLFGSFEARNLRATIILAVFASFTFLAAALMYEAVAPLAILPFLAPFVRSNVRSGSTEIRSNWQALLIWLLGLLGYAVYFVSIVVSGSTYQGDITQGSSSSRVSHILGRLPDALTYSFNRAFYEAWSEAADFALQYLHGYWVVLLFAAAVFTTVTYLDRYDAGLPKHRLTRVAKLFALGIILFVVGYAPYLPSTSHLFITQRTFLVSALGSATAVTSLLYLLVSFAPRIVFSLSATILISLSLISQLYQFDRYSRIYADHIKPSLNLLTVTAGLTPDAKVLTIMNESGSLSGTWDFGIAVQSADNYIFARERRIVVCDGYNNRLMPLAFVAEAQKQTCRIGSGSGSLEGSTSSDDLHSSLVHWKRDGSVSVENTQSNITVQPIPTRALELLGLGHWTKADSLFRTLDRTDRFVCEFESMWGYAYPCRSYGFYDGAVARHGLAAISFAWAVERKAGVIFDLRPTENEYSIVIDLRHLFAPPGEVRLVLNGIPVHDLKVSSTKLTAKVSSDWFKDKANVLEIEAPLEVKSGLSAAVDRITVIPVHAKAGP
jgi:hypothetical protein